MNGRATVELTNTIEGIGLTVKVPADQKKLIREIVVHSLKSKNQILIDLSINVKAEIISAFGSDIAFQSGFSVDLTRA